MPLPEPKKEINERLYLIWFNTTYSCKVTTNIIK